MPDTFLHGVEVVEIDTGSRPIRTVRSSVIGLVGTAPNADNTKYPLNTPMLITSDKQASEFGVSGTIYRSLKGIFDQIGAVVVVVRVAVGANNGETISNIIGGTDNNGNRTGLHALLDATSILGLQPRILIAPTFSQDNAVRAELDTIANRLRAVAVISGLNTQDEDVIVDAGDYGSKRLYMVDPYVQTFWNGSISNEDATARVAGLIAKIDNDKGFWWSPSNNILAGVLGTQRPIDFVMGDANARANLLNEANVATVINEQGYRLWGNRTLSSDAKWAFLSVVRTADIINDSILKAHLWAVDRNITKTYLEEVAEGVNAYLRDLKNIGAILGGKCWANPDLNSPSNIAQGKVYFDFDFTPPYPAEHITFRSILTNGYLSEVI